MRKPRLVIAIVLGAAVFLATGCQSTPPSSSKDDGQKGTAASSKPTAAANTATAATVKPAAQQGTATPVAAQAASTTIRLAPAQPASAASTASVRRASAVARPAAVTRTARPAARPTQAAVARPASAVRATASTQPKVALAPLPKPAPIGQVKTKPAPSFNLLGSLRGTLQGALQSIGGLYRTLTGSAIDSTRVVDSAAAGGLLVLGIGLAAFLNARRHRRSSVFAASPRPLSAAARPASPSKAA